MSGVLQKYNTNMVRYYRQRTTIENSNS